jgi:hypothetical protein
MPAVLLPKCIKGIIILKREAFTKGLSDMVSKNWGKLKGWV